MVHLLDAEEVKDGSCRQERLRETELQRKDSGGVPQKCAGDRRPWGEGKNRCRSVERWEGTGA